MCSMVTASFPGDACGYTDTGLHKSEVPQYLI
jgi:hypothetical protein